MRYVDAVERYGRWQERWRDPMLTGLLVLLALEAFIGTPLARAHVTEAPLTICLGSGSTVVFMAALIWVVWGAVFGPGRVTHHRIQGAVVIYLCLALSFAALYAILVALNPGAISGVTVRGSYLVLGPNLVYYSLSTITSTGYGDIVPVLPLARSLSNLEAVIGQLFPATLLARIVMLEMQARRHDEA